MASDLYDEVIGEVPNETATAPPIRTLPPVWIYAFSGVLAIGVVVLLFGSIVRRDIANIMIALAGFSGVTIPIVWMTFRSQLPAAIRTLPLLSLVAFTCAFFGKYRIVAVSGNLVPEFADRWQPLTDQLLPSARQLKQEITVESNSVNLSKVTPGDYPQFLGPTRRNVVENLELEIDWNAHHPKEQWRVDIGAGWSAFATANGFAVTLEQRDFEELVTCYDVETGELKWLNSIDTRPRHETILGGIGPRSTPTVDDGRVYVMGATGVLRCLDGATGGPIWIVDLLQLFKIDRDEFDAAVFWGRSASPLIIDGKVVVPVGGPTNNQYVTLAAFDKLTGELLWEGGSEQISYSSPMLAYFQGVQQIVYIGEQTASGISIDDGTILWKYEWPGSSSYDANTSQPVMTNDGKLFLSKGYGRGCALLEILRLGDGQWLVREIWTNTRTMRTKFTNVVIHGDYVYGISDGILECINLKDDGKRMWKRGRYNHGQVLLIGDMILVQAENGDVVLVEANPRQHVELHRLKALHDKTWNNLSLYGEFLLARNAVQAACFRLAVKPTSEAGGQVIEVLGGGDEESPAVVADPNSPRPTTTPNELRRDTE